MKQKCGCLCQWNPSIPVYRLQSDRVYEHVVIEYGYLFYEMK